MRKEMVITFSGIEFFPYDARPDEVRHMDIVEGLTKTCRYAGQIPRVLSVAEHSIKVAVITEFLMGEAVAAGELSADYIPLACLVALLHDAHEAYVGDFLGPLEKRLCDIYGTSITQLKQNLQDVIHEAYGIGVVPAEIITIVHMADRYAFCCEVQSLHPNYDYGNQQPPIEVQNAARVKLKEPERATVRQLYDGEVRRLCNVLGLKVPGVPNAAVRHSIMEEAEKIADQMGQPVPTLEQLMQNVPVPGERPPSKAPTKKPNEYLPSFTRTPRPSDISEGSWRAAIKSAAMPVPEELANEPEFNKPNPEVQS
jgi:hypothetical protein